jgi:SAM-dependent methyltransferase
MLDALLADRGSARWDEFFADRAKPVPFFTEWPDESLATWFDEGLLSPGRALELGCGNGRNAAYLAGRGCRVDAVDFSAQALEWAVARAGDTVSFQHCDVFAAHFEDRSYDLVYDSGCFHHLAPHRRQDYVRLVDRALKPGGHYGLVCFRPEGGSGYTDQQVYERASLGGGLGYSEDHLRSLWERAPFRVRVLRKMRKLREQELLFGEDFLWTLLAAKDAR